MSSRRRLRRDRGFAAVEMALLAPVLVAVLLLVVFAGRVSTLRADVRAAARDGARAASIRDNTEMARSDAEETVRAALANRQVSCADLAVVVDTSSFHPGGEVAVSVTCEVEIANLALVGVPGSKTVSASSVSVIDAFRSGQ